MASNHDAQIIAAIGASGSGKSLWVKSKLLKPKPKRLIIWDFKREYSSLAAPAENLSDLVKAVSSGRFAISWQPSLDQKRIHDEFDVVCAAAYAAGECTFLAEELAFVTTPSRAPQSWRMMTLTGRHEGMTVIGVSQRPASIDKDFLGNCTLVHCSRLNDRNDVRVMAQALGVSIQDVQSLPNLSFIERNMTTGAVVKGQVSTPR